MHSALMQDKEPEATSSNGAMTEGIQVENESAGESGTNKLSSQASEGTEPKGEVTIRFDE